MGKSKHITHLQTHTLGYKREGGLGRVNLKICINIKTIQSTLSKADTLGTKATVRFREVSALERVQLQRHKCNSAGSGPNLLSGLERCPV